MSFRLLYEYLALTKAYLGSPSTRAALRDVLAGRGPTPSGAASEDESPIAEGRAAESRPTLNREVTRIVLDSAASRMWDADVYRLIDDAPTRYALLLDSAVVIDDEAIDELHRVAAQTSSAFVQPVIVDEGGLVVDAGAVFVSRGSAPMRLFEGFLPAQLPHLDHYRSRAVVFPAVLIDRDSLPPSAGERRVDVALAQLSAQSGAVVALLARASVPDGAGRDVDDATRLAWSGRPTEALVEPRASTILASAGMVLDGVTGEGFTDFRRRLTENDLDVGRTARPVVRAVTARNSIDDANTRSTRRWTIRSGAPLGPEGRTWGDTFFADDLAAALMAAGRDVLIDTRETMVRPRSDQIDDVVVSLRGLYRIPTNPAAVNILWVISHPELVSVDEIESYDVVFAAGAEWARRMDALCVVPVRPLLQATSQYRFRPGPRDADLESDVLFVGKTRGIYRPIVRDALAVGADVAVYGDGWERFIDPAHVRREFLENERLSAAYNSARIVLNDHWTDMAEQGFLSNRLFDAVASGARVVTDPVHGIELFGGAVRAYHSAEELRELLTSDAGWPSDAARRTIVERIRTEHTFDARADELIRAADDAARMLRR